MRPTPSGRQPHSRAVVGASIPVRDNGYASAGAPKGFSLASLETFGHRSWRDPPWNARSQIAPHSSYYIPGKIFLSVSIFHPQSESPPFFRKIPPFPPHTPPSVFSLHES